MTVSTRKYLVLIPVLFAGILAYGKEADNIPTNKTSVQFITNEGQITDQHGGLRKDIDARIETNGVTMFVGDGQLHYQWVKSQKSGVVGRESAASGHLPSLFSYTLFKEGINIEIYRMDVTLVGANKNAEVVFDEPTGYYENYYLAHTGEDGVTANGYRRITYKNIYPNIDWVIYTSSPMEGGREGTKYDFIIHPGGDPADIRLRYGGATELEIVDGRLVAKTPLGTIKEEAPYSYEAETKKIIPSHYILRGNELTFAVSGYEGTLVIDPTLDWATYYGGSNIDGCDGVCTDSNDNIYISGHTVSTNNIVTTGAYQSTITTGYSGFVARFDVDGRRIWGTYYKIGSQTSLSNIACANNFIYTTGFCSSGGNLSSGVQQQSYGGGDSDGLLVKFNSNGGLVWSTYYGGTGTDDAETITTDAAGNLLIIGSTNSPNNIATTGAYITTLPSTVQSYFFSKFSPNGILIWGSYMGKVNRTWLNGICADKWNNVYIIGHTTDTSGIATSGTHKHTSSGTHYQAYLMKFTSAGNKIWGTYYGGSRHEAFNEVKCDNAGYIYVAGLTTSSDSISTTGAYQVNIGNTNTTYGDGMLIKFDSTGNRVWGTYYGGIASEGFYNLQYSKDNKIWATGGGFSSTSFATNDGYITSPIGGVDILMVQFDTAGNRLWASYFGGSQYDWSAHNNNMAFTNNNDILLAGRTESTTGISTVNSHQYYYGGASMDGFLAKITGDTVVSINKLLPDTICAGSSFYVPYRTTYPFLSNNTFKAQLSDSNGSFASPVNIGSKTGTTTDSIYCTIPSNTLPGTGYKIRITGTQKADTSLENNNELTITNVYPGNLSATSNSPLCPYDTLRLFASSTTTGLQYTWTGPGNFSSNSATPVIDSAGGTESGAYILNATYHACTGKDTVTVSIKPMPYTGSMSAQAAPTCEEDTLHLHIAAGVTGTAYSWTGPVNFSANTRLASVANFSTVHLGTYAATANLNGCIQKDSVTITNAKPLPPQPSATSNAPICEGTALQFNVTSSMQGVSFSWTGPNGFNSTSATSTILSSSPVHNGMYIASVILNGCVSYDTVNVVVDSTPAKPILSTNSPVCAGDTLHFTSTCATTGVAFGWAGPNSFTCTANDTSFIGSTSHSGLYTTTVSKNGCSNSDTITVLVKPAPAAVSVSNNGPVCAGDTLYINSGSSATGITYLWTGPLGYNATNEDTALINANPVQTGWYKLLLTLNGCTWQDSMYAVVTPMPVVHTTSYNSPLCVGETLNLSTGNITGASYSWNGTGNFTANTQKPARTQMKLSDTGWYYVSASVNGCISQTDSIKISLNPQPFVAIAASPGSTLCNGESALFTAYANNHGGTPSYQWYINNITTGTNTTTFNSNNLNDGDIVHCEMTEYTKCSMPYIDESNDITMTVNQWVAPKVTISSDAGPSLYPNEPINFTAVATDAGATPKYQWKRNGQDVGGATGAVWGANANFLSDGDDICVVVTSSYACPSPDTALSNCIKLNIRSAVGDVDNDKDIRIYPNPVRASLYLFPRERGQDYVVELYDVLGRKIMKQVSPYPPASGGETIVVDMSSLVSGVYIIKVNGSYVERIVKE